jgi:predicted MFS family arabinose efflux permease
MHSVHIVSRTRVSSSYADIVEAAGAPLGAVFGNVLSGLVASYASWRWVFWTLAFLAALVTVAGIFFIPPSVENRNPELSLAKSVDWIGGALITLGLMALLFALTEGNVVGWSNPWISMLIVIAFLLIFIFAAWQWYQEKHTSRAPLLKISIFKSKQFSAAMILMALFFGVMNDFLVYATFLYQDYQSLSPIQTTLRFLPAGIGGIIVAIIVSRLISKVPTWTMLMTGEFAIAMSCLLMAIPIAEDTSYFAYGFFAMIFAVVGADSAWPSLMLFTSKSLPEQ